MWAIFIISVQQWPLEFQDHFLSPSWCPHKRPRSTNIWGASLHLHICWHRRWRPLVDYKSRCCAEGQTHRLWEMGGRSKTWFLVSGLFGSPWKTRHFCEWRAEWGLVWRVRQEFAFRVLHLIPFFFILLRNSFFPSRIYLPVVSRIREILFIQRVACIFSYLSFQLLPQFWYPGHRQSGDSFQSWLAQWKSLDRNTVRVWNVIYIICLPKVSGITAFLCSLVVTTLNYRNNGSTVFNPKYHWDPF